MDHHNNSTDQHATPPDLERYLPDVRTQFVSEKDAIEFLQTLCNIMCAFVDLGWGVDSIHFALPELAKISSYDSASALSSSEHRTIKDEAKAAFAMSSNLEDS